MSTNFRITGLPAEAFDGIFALSDEALAARRAVRMVAKSCVPCRISLTDAEPGDEVILLNWLDHAVDTPYRSRFAIYVREGEQTYDDVNQVPEQLRRRALSLRAYDKTGMIVRADLVDGHEVERPIAETFADDRVAYLHIHFAKYGCYAAKVERA